MTIQSARAPHPLLKKPVAPLLTLLPKPLRQSNINYVKVVSEFHTSLEIFYLSLKVIRGGELKIRSNFLPLSRAVLPLPRNESREGGKNASTSP